MEPQRYEFHVNISFCFLCSDKILHDNSDENSFSLKYVLQYLNIKLTQIEALAKPIEVLSKTDIRVNLCDKCGNTFEEISQLCTTMEVIKMKLDYNFETIQRVLKSTLEVQNHQNRIKEGTESVSLRHFKVAKELQKEILGKCNLKMPNYQPRVNLAKVTDFTKAARMEEALKTLQYESTSGVIYSTSTSDGVFSSDFTFQPIKTEHVGDGDNDNVSELQLLESSNCDVKFSPEVCKIESLSTIEDFTENFANKVQDEMQVPTFSRNSSTGNYDCPACNKPFKSGFYIRRHYESVHLLKRFKCDICNVSEFSQLSKLKMHKKTCNGTGSNKARQGKLKNVYYTKDSINKMYECKKCDKKYQTHVGITDHYEAVHLKIRYPCDICNISVFSTSGSLTQHKKTCLETCEQRMAKVMERSQFKIVCKLCGKRFVSEKSLRTHRFYIHENANGFPCDICGKRFKRSKLQMHKEEVHLGKLFSCRFCNVKFKSYWKMRYHLRKCTMKSKNKSESAN